MFCEAGAVKIQADAREVPDGHPGPLVQRVNTASAYRVNSVPFITLVSSVDRVVFSARLAAEARVPPGAIFTDENRRLTAQGCDVSLVPIRRVPG